MTDGNTGSGVDPAESAENYLLHKDFSKAVMDLWVKYQQGATMDPSRFARVTMQSLLHTAATLSVDLHQPERDFSKIAVACHQIAYFKAPKFG